LEPRPEGSADQAQNPAAAEVRDRGLHEPRGRRRGDVDRALGAEQTPNTSGRTSVGPGRKNRPNSMGFVTITLIGSGNGIRRGPNAVDRAKILRSRPPGKRSRKVAPREVDAAAGRPEVDAPVSAMLPGQGGPGPFTSEPARCDTSS
jgi:hypothetical protein